MGGSWSTERFANESEQTRVSCDFRFSVQAPSSEILAGRTSTVGESNVLG
jgi:hypothetical protein